MGLAPRARDLHVRHLPVLHRAANEHVGVLLKCHALRPVRCRGIAKAQQIELPKRKPDQLLLPVNFHREPLAQPVDPRHCRKLRLHEPKPLVRVGEKNPVAFVDALLTDLHRTIAQLPRLPAAGLRLAVEPRHVGIGRGQHEILTRVCYSRPHPALHKLPLGLFPGRQHVELPPLLVRRKRLLGLAAADLRNRLPRPRLPLPHDVRQHRLLVARSLLPEFSKQPARPPMAGNCRWSPTKTTRHPAFSAGRSARLSVSLSHIPHSSIMSVVRRFTARFGWFQGGSPTAVRTSIFAGCFAPSMALRSRSKRNRSIVELLTPALFSSSRAARWDGVSPMTVPPSFSIAGRATAKSIDFPEPGAPWMSVRSAPWQTILTALSLVTV